MWRLILTLIFCCYLILTFSQTERAQQLRQNVVAISAQGLDGFGFITGERFDKLFVVTAAHTVEVASEGDNLVDVKFFNDYNRYKGKVIRNYPDRDIALLEVQKPNRFSWIKNCLGEAKMDESVAFIGRNGEWYIPKGPALGIINDLETSSNLIKIDINSISQGSSGAPLITRGGIIGMVVQTDGITASALDLNELRRMLSEYNYFFSLSGQSGTTTTPNNNRNRTEPPRLNIATDRDGNTYATKIMKDSKRWMTKNLNIKVSNSWCYDDKASNCDTYGRLYTFESAKEGCQLLGNGWRLPTEKEWREMAIQYGGVDEDAKDKGMKAYVALSSKFSSGFAAELAGWRNRNGAYFLMGDKATFWSSSARSLDQAWYFDFDRYHIELYLRYSKQVHGRSVRCIKDN